VESPDKPMTRSAATPKLARLQTEARSRAALRALTWEELRIKEVRAVVLQAAALLAAVLQEAIRQAVALQAAALP
jgi:hypothetical protein